MSNQREVQMIHPGATLEEKLDSMGMQQIELARRTGITAKTINSIIKGSTPISPETAMALEAVVVGTTAREWLNMETDYQLKKLNTIKEDKISDEIQFLEDIDLKEMIKAKWIAKKEKKIDLLKELYTFFGVSSLNQLSPVWAQLEVNYRTSTSYTQNHLNIMAWLRRGELKARERKYKPYNTAEFKKALLECRTLTNQPFEEIHETIQNLCANAGVAVVFVKELPKVGMSGAAHWLDKETALIQLSLRGKQDDKFWFNFYHEAGHILLHGRKEQFIDNHGKGLMSSGEDGDASPYFTEENKLKEAEADEFSGSFLIPKKSFSKFVSEKNFSPTSIKKFAATEGISPGIVQGQLQNKGYLPWNSPNLKRRYVFPQNMA